MYGIDCSVHVAYVYFIVNSFRLIYPNEEHSELAFSRKMHLRSDRKRNGE